ncbi:MAG: hypothetical protein P1U56_08675 [Saprospiraceae bacterium]|nr:hypothetical protein [Saprospiraceae bacterium]
MGKFSLEQKIKERLQGHEVHIDKQELWKGLGIEEEKEDRKFIWFWWLGGLAALVAGAGLWWFSQNNVEMDPISQNTTIIAVDEQVAKTGNETNTESTITDRLTQIVKEVQDENPKNGNAEASINNNTEPNANTSEQENKRTLEDDIENVIPSNMEQKFAETTTAQIENGDRNNTVAIASTQEVETESELTNDGETKTPSLSQVTSIGRVGGLLDFEREKITIETSSVSMVKPVSTSRKFEFEMFASLASFDRTMTAEDDRLDGYLSIRDTSEVLLEHVSVGVSLRYNMIGGLYSKMGVTVNRWNEQYSYISYGDTTEVTVEVPDVILVDLQGNENITYIDGTQLEITKETWTRYNRLTQIDIPLTLGYEQRIGKWSMFGEASAIFNLRQSFSGYLRSTDGIAVQNPKVFKTRVGMNMGLNAGVGYGFTPRVRARVSANYYRSLQSVVNGDAGWDQRYSSLGVRLGVGYLF